MAHQSTSRRPSLGSTQNDIMENWRRAENGYCGSRGLLQPFALDVHSGKEYFWSGTGRLQRVVGPGLCADATAIEETELQSSVRDGAVEIYLRGTWGPSIDRRYPTRVLHRATGQAIA